MANQPMPNPSYVRTEMLPEQAPPANAVGVVGWLRANLFSSIPNTILTLVSLYFIYYILAGIIPWTFQSVWNAGSLNECREIAHAAYGEGREHACWAVINERWIQLLFGFYPPEHYWRPILALLLLFVALAPVLFAEKVPSQLIWVTAVYPFILPWLMWGGTAWMPVMLIASFGVGALAWKVMDGMCGKPGLYAMGAIGGILFAALVYFIFSFVLSASLDVFGRSWAGFGGAGWIGKIFLGIILLVAGVSVIVAFPIKWLGSLASVPLVFLGVVKGEALAKVLTAVALVLALLFLVAGPVAQGVNSVIPIGLEPVVSRNFGGFMLAILIGVVAIGVSLPLGILLALGRQSNLPMLKIVCVGFIEFIRGVPLITLLFVASTLLNIFLPPGTSFDIILRVMIMVTLFAAAYMAEVIRGGLAALPRGQYEGADSLGLNYWQSQRLIIMPQALKISIPGIVSTFIGVFKDTVLVSIIGLLDPLGLTQGIRSNQEWNGIYWELFAFIGVLFFIVCFGMSRYSMYLERKLKTSH